MDNTSEIQNAIAFFKRCGVPYADTSLAALQEQAERDKGCEYCNNEKVFGINFGGEKAGIAYLHKCSDGWGLFLEMDNGSTYYTDVVNCPMCGRRLK
jgi:DNA-directed RNA polymerase subunit RPC12/RpoP